MNPILPPLLADSGEDEEESRYILSVKIGAPVLGALTLIALVILIVCLTYRRYGNIKKANGS